MTPDEIETAAIEAADVEYAAQIVRNELYGGTVFPMRAAIRAYERAMWSKSMRGAPDDVVILVESRDEYGEWSVDPALNFAPGKWETMGGTILNKPRSYRPLPRREGE